MSNLNEPIEHTCHDINKYIKEIQSTLKYIKGFDRIENAETLIDLLNDCENTLSSAIDNFELIRKDNDKLRKWGQTLSDSMQKIINEVSDYE